MQGPKTGAASLKFPESGRQRRGRRLDDPSQLWLTGLRKASDGGDLAGKPPDVGSRFYSGMKTAGPSVSTARQALASD